MEYDTQFTPTGGVLSVPPVWIDHGTEEKPTDDSIRFYAVTWRPGAVETYRAFDDGTVWDGPFKTEAAVQVLYASGDGERVLMREYETEVTADGDRQHYHIPPTFAAEIAVADPADAEGVINDEYADYYRERVRELHLAETGETAINRPGDADVTTVTE